MKNSKSPLHGGKFQKKRKNSKSPAHEKKIQNVKIQWRKMSNIVKTSLSPVQEGNVKKRKKTKNLQNFSSGAQPRKKETLP